VRAVGAEPRTGLRRTASKELVDGASKLLFEARRPQLRQLAQGASKLGFGGGEGAGGRGGAARLDGSRAEAKKKPQGWRPWGQRIHVSVRLAGANR
jgi:hypothetical protein